LGYTEHSQRNPRQAQKQNRGKKKKMYTNTILMSGKGAVSFNMGST
jgi:hypothetical protein